MAYKQYVRSKTKNDNLSEYGVTIMESLIMNNKLEEVAGFLQSDEIKDKITRYDYECIKTYEMLQLFKDNGFDITGKEFTACIRIIMKEATQAQLDEMIKWNVPFTPTIYASVPVSAMKMLWKSGIYPNPAALDLLKLNIKLRSNDLPPESGKCKKYLSNKLLEMRRTGMKVGN